MNHDQLHIREALHADREFVRDLGMRTSAVNLSPLRPASVERVMGSYDRLLEFVYTASHVVLVAVLAQRQVGFLIMLDSMPDEVTNLPQAFVAYAAVEADVRGTGIGKALFVAAETCARERGLGHISLMVTDNNDPAVSLYTSLGYQTERRLLCKTL